MKSVLLVFVAAALGLSAYAASLDTRSGLWTAEIEDGTVQMSLFRSSRRADHVRPGINNLLSFEEPVTRFSGLSAEEFDSAAANVNFELRRSAGTIAFEGRVAGGTGAGHYRFTPDEAFVREMDWLGYRGFTDEQLLMFAACDFQPQTVRELRAMGYEPTQSEIEEIAVFRITASLLREFAALGYPHLTLQEAVNFRVGRVDAAWIRSMRELGYTEVPAKKLGDLAILGVGPQYVRELRDLGYSAIPAGQLEEMRALGVTPDYIRKLAKKGYANVPIEKLIQLRALGTDRILFK